MQRTLNVASTAESLLVGHYDSSFETIIRGLEQKNGERFVVLAMAELSESATLTGACYCCLLASPAATVHHQLQLCITSCSCAAKRKQLTKELTGNGKLDEGPPVLQALPRPAWPCWLSFLQ